MARVLVIDDDSATRSVVCRMVQRGGHAALEARNGREGVQSVNRNRLDLVVTDILMPEQDGVETIRRIRAIDSRLPIIAMSGAAEGTGLGSLLSNRDLAFSFLRTDCEELVRQSPVRAFGNKRL